MTFNFSYTQLDAMAIFNQLKTAYGNSSTGKRLDVPAGLGKGYTQYLMLLSGIEILLSEYDYNRDILFKHAAENTDDLVLWRDMAITSGQQVSINHLHKDIDNPEQLNAYLLNSGFNFSLLRTKGTRGKSIMIFLPRQLMVQFFDPVYLQEVLVNYYAVLCNSKLKGLFKKIYGQSVYEYFNISRLNKARHLLQENNLSIKEVACQMGY